MLKTPEGVKTEAEFREWIETQVLGMEVYAWCVTCQALLLGAERHSSYWGKRVIDIARLHRKVTKHEVYIGGTMDK